DNGGTANGGADTFSRTFTVTVAAATTAITGQVTDAVTLAAIAGATVRTQDGPTFATTTTDTTGRYTLSVSAGSYHVQALASGYAAQYNGGFTANFQAPF